MKQWLMNIFLLTVAIGVGIALFLRRQQVVKYEKDLNQLSVQILLNKREIHTLKADWAVLTEPSRLRRLLAESHVQQIGVKQVVHPDEVALKPVPVPRVKPIEVIEESQEQP